MSVEKATDAHRADVVARMRLRGIFQPARSTATDLARQVGTGRFVSLVYDQPDGAATGIASLMVDGKCATVGPLLIWILSSVVQGSGRISIPR